MAPAAARWLAAADRRGRGLYTPIHPPTHRATHGHLKQNDCSFDAVGPTFRPTSGAWKKQTKKNKKKQTRDVVMWDIPGILKAISPSVIGLYWHLSGLESIQSICRINRDPPLFADSWPLKNPSSPLLWIDSKLQTRNCVGLFLIAHTFVPVNFVVPEMLEMLHQFYKIRLIFAWSKEPHY